VGTDFELVEGVEMKTVTIYEYDRQLYPGTLGADFTDGNSNHDYTLRYEKEDGEALMRDLRLWFYGEYAE
jgi:hypothetical protein